MTVIVLGDLIEDAPVAAGVELVRHGFTVDDGRDGRTARPGETGELAARSHRCETTPSRPM
jgi:hypothetical protein